MRVAEAPTSSTALRLDSGDPARKTAWVPARLCASSPPTRKASSPTRVSLPGVSSSAAISRRLNSGAEVAMMSRISRPSSDSLPTRATVARLTNLMLRLLRRGVPETPPHDPSNANHDAAAHIRRGQQHQYRLRVVPHRINQPAQQDDDERRVSLVQVDPLEAVIAPGADHQKAEQQQQGQPGYRGRPPDQGLRVV